MFWIIIWILLFMFLVMIHEFGHYFAAKWAKVKVLEFGIGIPPKLKTFFTDKSGTEWTANWIPLGGFVRLKGEDPSSDDFLAKDSFITAGLFQKLVILFAWVTVNAIFAWIAFSLAFQMWVKPINIVPENMIEWENRSLLMPSLQSLEEKGFLSGSLTPWPALIGGVIPGSLASQIALQSGDVITYIDTFAIDSRTLWQMLKTMMGKNFQLSYIRDGNIYTTWVVCPEENCLLGVQIKNTTPFDIKTIKYPGVQAWKAWWTEVVAQTELTRSMLKRLGKNLFSGDRKKAASSVSQMSGPVGIVKMGEMILKEGGFWMYLAFGGMISLGLAIFNLLPIPALDGGRAVGVLIQSIFGLKPENYFNIEGYLNMIVFWLMMGLGIYIILLDLVRFWWVKVPFFS
jgi:regulator of sigma E protease